MIRVILFGAPGAGKGTQAQFITEKYAIPKISTGEILRTSMKSKSELQKKIIDTINAGQLVKDEIVISLIKDRILQKDCCNGFLLDGFPRTISQVHAIKAMGIIIDYVLEFSVPDELIIDRIAGRLVHKTSGRVYHVKFNPPKKEGKDDIDGEKLILREDDREEIVRNRLIRYHQITEPLIDYYQKEAELGNTKYVKIDGTKTIMEIQKNIEVIFDKKIFS